MDEEKEASVVHSWERRLLIIAFGGWAAVVAAYGQAAINRIDKIVEAQTRDRDANSEVHGQIIQRLTIVEQNDKTMNRQLDKIERHIDDEIRNDAARH